MNPTPPSRRLSAAMLAAALAGPASAQTFAPTFDRPFTGVPVGPHNFFLRITPEEQIDFTGDCERQLDVGGCPPTTLPAFLPPRFTEPVLVPSTTGMTVGDGYFGQFVAHDLQWLRESGDFFLIPPFVPGATFDEEGMFANRRTPGFDLEALYERGPFDGLSVPDGQNWYDESRLRFRLGPPQPGGFDFLRDPRTGVALTGDSRNDENGIVGQLHRAFQMLHNRMIDLIVARDGIDEEALVPGSELYWNIFHEARNYTIAYYQGIVMNEYAPKFTGRTLFQAMADAEFPPGEIVGASIPLEFGAAMFRGHTLIPELVQIGQRDFVSPIDPVLREGVTWNWLFGPAAPPASRIDLGHAPAMRDIVDLVTPGFVTTTTMDIAQVSVLRGREMGVPSGEEYLAFLLNEHGLDPATTTFRGKQVVTLAAAQSFLDPELDADLLADLAQGDTDLYAFIFLEAELNGGVLGPIGQDILERVWIGVLLADDWSLIGSLNDQYTPEQLSLFTSATWTGLLHQILESGDLNFDDHVNAGDLAILLAAWSLPPGTPGCRGATPCAADLNSDAAVNASDLAILLGNWN